METSIVPGLHVVVDGEPAKVIDCQSNARVRVYLLSTRIETSVDISEIVLIPTNSSQVDGDGEKHYSFKFSENLSNEEVEICQKREEAVRDYLSGIQSLEDSMRMTGLKRARFYQLLKRYDQEFGILSLARYSRGRKLGQTRLPKEIEEIIRISIKEKFKGKAATVAAVYRDVKNRCAESKFLVPSRWSVALRVKRLGVKETHKLKHGAAAAEDHYGAKPGRHNVSAPLEWVQMDHTLVDVILCSDIDRKPLGRPWLTVLIDVYSRVIIGYYLAYHAPSTLSVACAVTNSVFPKQPYLKSLDREDVNYPFFGVMKTLHMDNAKEFKTPKLSKACAIHNINTKWRPLGKKHFGGHVERLIGTLMTTHVHFLPGTTLSNTQKRKGYDSDKTAAMTFREFSRWFVGEVEKYHGAEHRALGMAPAEKWIEYFSSAGGYTYPPLVNDPFRFRLDFMPEIRRSIHAKGVVISNLWYWSPALTPYIGRGNVIVKYDPFSMQKVWVKIDGEYIAINYSDVTKADISFEEHRISKLKPGGKSISAWMHHEDRADKTRKNEDIVKESKKLTRRARKREAAEREYLGSHLHENYSKPQLQVSVESINYSEKPSPFDSEDA
ncbi:integrase [Pseudomonas taiwanensis]|uniref:Mu transposase C-terminal domain-containing protein n=1 Tax=Pseudomonas taiwanensis TaxID=470150 RepID=UPI0015BA4FFB|nr:Mu transposase C-terminal domain-containing protein [Pseudomonas taiwanensis]NWL76590.1 integrase [Pseudomonas taiwanensis]